MKSKNDEIEHMWKDIRHKDKVIKDKDDLIDRKNSEAKTRDKTIKQKDNQIYELKEDMQLLKTENKIIISENQQLLTHNFDLRKAIDENEKLRYENIKRFEDISNKIEIINQRSNKILSFMQFSQVEASNNFSEIISNMEDNIREINNKNKEFQKQLDISQEE